MLTRDFTCSRKRSQAFVAVVIARENLTPLISTDVNKLWKAGPFSSFFRLRESCPYRSVLLSPGAPRAALQNCRPLVPLLSDSAGLSPIGWNGASEKCAKAFTGVHTPCTVFPQAQFLCNSTGEHAFARKFSLNFHARAHLCTGSFEIALRIIRLLCRFFTSRGDSLPCRSAAGCCRSPSTLLRWCARRQRP